MLIEFFFKLRAVEIPASITEYLTLLEGFRRGVAGYSVDDFYYLSRATLVKDERHYDRFDRVFGAHFKGLQELFDTIVGEIPEEWLRRQAELMLSEEEKREIEALGLHAVDRAAEEAHGRAHVPAYPGGARRRHARAASAALSIPPHSSSNEFNTCTARGPALAGERR